VRVFYRVSFVLFFASGHMAAWLATRYRGAAHSSDQLSLLVVPVQLVLLVAWLPARIVSLGTFAVCRSLAPRVTPEHPVATAGAAARDRLHPHPVVPW
jgi:hypothetical protein